MRSESMYPARAKRTAYLMRLRSSALRASALLLLAATCCAVGAGCWTKREVEIIRVGVTPYPEEADGALYVAQNDPVRVGIVGTDTITKKDVGGYVLIHKDDFRALVRALREREARP